MQSCRVQSGVKNESKGLQETGLPARELPCVIKKPVNLESAFCNMCLLEYIWTFPFNQWVNFITSRYFVTILCFHIYMGWEEPSNFFTDEMVCTNNCFHLEL